jgi:hypothetical protein
MMPIGVIGLGLMGSALAERLLGAGHRVMGWDVDPGRIAELCERGGEIAKDAQQVFSGCRRVIEPAQPSRGQRRGSGGGRTADPRSLDHRYDHWRSGQHRGAGEESRRSRDHLAGCDPFPAAARRFEPAQ